MRRCRNRSNDLIHGGRLLLLLLLVVVVVVVVVVIVLFVTSMQGILYNYVLILLLPLTKLND